ncbi:hypothetical protein ACH5RR_034878 [Cinchona calisaya]|uniref:Growth-regulating factor n=1 Tax=Cinchona calisaya TaxID=153742 RepID=A0ABD2YGM7_9GENT
MDFGVESLEIGHGGLMCSVTNTSDADETKQKWYGSGFLKQERSGTTEDDLRDLKVAKTSPAAAVDDDFSASKAMNLQQRNSLLRSNCTNNLYSDGQHMLSFSSPNSQSVTLPYYHPSSIGYARNAGYSSGGLSAGNMHGVLSGVRGPFTPSQWLELEHQALIYKYISANVPIPSYLLTPIRKALDSAGFSSFVGLRPNAFGWGAFHLGFSNSTDPEPGRCRRTDGKKWRCSRDAVADQKYCERHMNRGRHRSRKPVEGQPGHSVAGTTNNAAKLMPTSSASAAVVPGGGASNNLGLSPNHQLNNLQTSTTNQCAASPQVDRSFLEKENLGGRFQDIIGLSIISPSINLKENQYRIPKQQNPYQESSRGEFGQVCFDSLLNPLDRSTSLVNCSNYGTSEDINDHESKSRHGLRQFMDDWPNKRSERSGVSWPDIDMQSDRTQLSISISMAASDFMSSTSSPTNEKLAASPLRLSRELEATQMGLGVGTIVNDCNHRQANWIPISWESSMGGPLAEALHSTNRSTGDRKSASALNLMTEGWDGSPQLASSPTGVLQKAALVSLSNSSTGSSPRAETSKPHEGASLCGAVLRSTLINPALPAL